MNSTTYISVQYTNAQNTVLCLLAEKMGRVMPAEAKRAQILGSKHGIYWQRAHSVRTPGDKSCFTDPLVFMWRAGGVQKGWDNSNAHRNDLQYIYYEPVQIKKKKNSQKCSSRVYKVQNFPVPSRNKCSSPTSYNWFTFKVE